MLQDRFSRLDRIPRRVTDGRTDRHRTTAKTALCRASRGKNVKMFSHIGATTNMYTQSIYTVAHKKWQ